MHSAAKSRTTGAVRGRLRSPCRLRLGDLDRQGSSIIGVDAQRSLLRVGIFRRDQEFAFSFWVKAFEIDGVDALSDTIAVALCRCHIECAIVTDDGDRHPR